MKQVALQDAKARFGQLVEEAVGGPAIITRNGAQEAVLIPVKPEKSQKIVQGKRGTTDLFEALRSAPSALPLKRLRGRFRPVEL